MPRDPEPLKPIEKPTITREQLDGLRRHNMTQICGLTRYELSCACGWRSVKKYRIRNKADAMIAQDRITQHLVEVCRDLGIAQELVQ